MENFLELFKFDFFQNAIFASILISISCGIIGTYIVSKRIVFIATGVTHASFGGLGAAHFFGFNPILGAIIFAIITSLTTSESSISKVSLLYETFAKICRLLTGQDNSFESNFFGRTDSEPDQYGSDGDGSLTTVTNGRNIRNVTNLTFFANFSKVSA